MQDVRDENGGAMFGEYWMSRTASRWLARGGGSRREAKPSPSPPTMIKKIDSKYVVLSETTGRKMGTYSTKKEAQKRLRQVEFFKHLKSSPGLRSKLKKKSLPR